MPTNMSVHHEGAHPSSAAVIMASYLTTPETNGSSRFDSVSLDAEGGKAFLSS